MLQGGCNTKVYLDFSPRGNISGLTHNRSTVLGDF